MNTHKLMLAVLLASLALPALAEDTTVRLRTETVKNAPYTAQAVTERLQNLGDGNQIARKSSSLTYRDSAGRTRRDIARGDDTEASVVTINDPVAGVTWLLKPQDHTATRIPHRDSAELRALADAARKAGDPAREQIIVKRVERLDGDARQRLQENVRIHVARTLEENGPALRALQARLAPLTAGAFGDMKWAAKASTKDLGSRDFGGVKAEGKLRSYEIPAGEIGNRNPIVVTDESWYAPDLQVTVYTKHSDPRTGDTVYRLENLKREEPAASLFAVPSDYTVKDPLARLARPAGARGQ